MVRVMVVLVMVVRRLDVHQLRRNAGEILVLLLELHSPILEPNLNLSLG